MKVTRKVLAGIGKGLLTLGLVLTITGCIVACVLTVYIATAFGGEQNLPDVDTINQHQTSIIMVYDEATGGYVEHQRIQGINRVWVDYQDMPQYLVNAVVAIEDERFHEHYGVDWKRTVLAVVNMVMNGMWRAPKCKNKMYLTTLFRLPNTSLPRAIHRPPSWLSTVLQTVACS